MKNDVSNRDWIENVRVLSFDLDDTLWDCASVIRHAEQKLHTWFTENTPSVVAAHGTKTVMHRRAQVVAEHPHLAHDMSLLRHKIIELLLLDAGFPAALADEAYDVFYRARSEVTLYDGAAEVLAALGEKYRLAVITNGNADLELIGLANQFQHIQRASVNKAPKPDPHMFHQCLDEFSIPASALVHIGDNCETDVGGGQSIGARTVWFNQSEMTWPVTQRRADVEVSSLQELCKFFLPEYS